jgi:NitT/TauT family transport system permease protein
MRPTRVLGFVLVAGLLGVWEIAAQTGVLDARFVPAPSTIAVAWVGFATSGQLLTDLLATLSSWAQGYLIAAVLGVVLGLVMGLVPVVRAMLSTTVELLRPMPSVAIIPIAIVLFGLGDPMKRFVVAYAALWPVLINTFYGVRAVDPGRPPNGAPVPAGPPPFNAPLKHARGGALHRHGAAHQH